VPEEELFEELYTEGIDADDVVAGVRAVMQRIHGKLRILGVPVNDNEEESIPWLIVRTTDIVSAMIANKTRFHGPTSGLAPLWILGVPVNDNSKGEAA
jgi:hypothetical protein